MLEPAFFQTDDTGHLETLTARTKIKNAYINLKPTATIQALSLAPNHPVLLKIALKQMKSHYYSHNNQLQLARLLAYQEPTLSHLVLYGRLLDENNLSTEAISFFEQALLQKPKDSEQLFEIYNFLGNAYLKIADFESAEENYHKAFTINPRSSQLHVNLGTLAIQKNDWYLVQHHFREALKLQSNNDRAWTGIAIYHQYMGDRELALAALKKALDLNPTSRPALLLLASWNNPEKIDETIRYITRYLGENQWDNEISLLLIHFCVRNQDFDLAELEIEKLVCQDPHNHKYYEIYCEIQEVLNELKRLPQNSIKSAQQSA